MKCLNCGEREAAYKCSCLKIRHKVIITPILNQRETHEQAVGIEPVGLCEKCQKKLIWKHRTTLASGKVYGIAVMIFVLGMIISGAGFFNSANGGGSETLQILGLVIAMVPCVLAVLYDFIVAPAKLRKTPYKVLGRVGVDVASLLREGEHNIYVPLGDGFYKNEKEFNLVNGLLMDEVRKQIYEKLVITGAWKQAGFAVITESDKPVGNSGNLLEDSVNKLLILYRQNPGGFLTSRAGDVRAVGKELNEAGGMDLMLQAHSMFQAKNPLMARNLEMVWDGIGEWRG